MPDTTESPPASPALDGIELDDDVDVFDVGMFTSGAVAGGFHTKNNPKDPYQRSQVVQRSGAIDVRCTVVDIIHGAMSDDSEFWATLMVLQFRFDPQKKSRRVSAATLSLQFDPLDPDDEVPEVEAVSFDGHYSLVPSKQTEHVTKGLTGSAGVSYVAETKLEPKWEKTVERETTDATTVSGGKYVVNNVEPNRVAKWTLLENKTLKTGIPSSLRVAVLVKRRDEKNFTCMPKIEVKADKWTRMETCFSRVEPDDAVILQPTPDRKPTNKLMVYNVEELGSLDLQKLSDVTFTTMITDGIKSHQQQT
ncbi:hypothetical protein B0T17DRAFT_530280 [Bombardia bombarda]|uniref:Uncharacterized protein n=1 Tax=Bombardia bombarda TaxID=252184 RepID=A0AA39XC17_9PEZI|nr:hypothetical protein B0T17DRAFT_530280 [Bombardia bombarda]